jgi:hypothetical protein
VVADLKLGRGAPAVARSYVACGSRSLGVRGGAGVDLVVAELVALDLDVLAALVAIALVAAVVAELEPPHARHRRAQLDPAPWWSRRVRGRGGRGPKRSKRHSTRQRPAC